MSKTGQREKKTETAIETAINKMWGLHIYTTTNGEYKTMFANKGVQTNNKRKKR